MSRSRNKLPHVCCSDVGIWPGPREALAGTLHPPQGTYTLPLVHHADTVERVRVADTSLQASLRREATAGSHSEIGHPTPREPPREEDQAQSWPAG